MISFPDTDTKGPAHSEYAKVVVPVKVTVVPSFNPVRSRVFPAGTDIDEIVMSVFEDFAEATSSKLLMVIDCAFTAAAKATARLKRAFVAGIVTFLDTDEIEMVRPGVETCFFGGPYFYLILERSFQDPPGLHVKH